MGTTILGGNSECESDNHTSEPMVWYRLQFQIAGHTVGLLEMIFPQIYLIFCRHVGNMIF